MQHLHLFDPKVPSKNPPLVFFLHSATGNARMFQGADMRLLQDKGIACAALEAPYARSRNSVQRRGLLDARNERCLWDQTVEELAMALDEAISRWHCDPEQVGFVGLNLGGGLGGYWLAKGPPVKAAVLTGAVPDLTEFWLHSPHPVAEAARAQEGVDLPAFESRMRETDLLATLPKFSQMKTLVQIGTQDPWINEEAKEKLKAVVGSLPNAELSLIEDDHEMRSLAAIRERVSFFEKAFSVAERRR